MAAKPTSDLSPDLTEVAARYEAALPAGTLLSFSVTQLDKTGVPSWSVTLIPGSPSGGHGYGWSDAQAKVSALGELHERLQSQLVVPTLPTERASYAELAETYGERFVTDPLTLSLPAGSPYTPEMSRLWVSMTRFGTGETVWVPLESAASSPAELPTGYEPLYLSVSNGLGAGFSTEQALSHAVFELLQRDGNSVNYRALDQGVGVDLTGAELPERVTELLGRLADQGVEVQVKLAATDFGLTNVYVVGAKPVGETPGIMAAGAGEACHPDREVALEKALLEFAAARTRLAFNHGPLARVQEVTPPGYLGTYQQAFGDLPEEARALAAMREWLSLEPKQLRDRLAKVYEVRQQVPWRDLPHVQPADPLTDAVTRLVGFELLYLELAGPQAQEHGVTAVKAVVPGLEVETVSYARLGARNLTRLLDRKSPFAGLGAPPAGAVPIRLTAEAEATFGAPAWLDANALKQSAEPLYPLYREPSRHAARWAELDTLDR